MANKENYTAEDIRYVTWYEAIRRRPTMYLGQNDMKGFVKLLKDLFSNVINDLKSSAVSFEITKSHSAIFRVKNIQSPVIDNWSGEMRGWKFIVELYHLNALSEIFEITLLDENQKCIYTKKYAKGVFLTGDPNKREVSCSEMEIRFTLDKEIWGNKFEWNENFLNYGIREFAYSHKNVKFKFLYPFEGENSNITYAFRNGIKDLFDLEKFKRLKGYESYLETYIDEQIEDFHIEAAFAFTNYANNQPFLKSFVNGKDRRESGSHVDGLLKGLTQGLVKHYHKYNFKEVYNISKKGISEKRIKENLMVVINIRGEHMVMSRLNNKLEFSRIIKPIADYVADVFFKKIESDKDSAYSLINQLEI